MFLHSSPPFVPCVKLNYDFVVLNGWKVCFDVMSAVERLKFLLQHPFIVSPVLPKADLTGSLSSGMLGEQGPCVGETSVVYTRWMVRPLQSLVGNWETETGAVSATTNLWNCFYQFQLIQTQMNPEQFKVHHPVYKLT